MKRAVLIVVILAICSTAGAQQIDLTPKNVRTHAIYVNGGLAAPFGELYKRTKLGGTGGVGFGICPFGAEFPDFETIVHFQAHYFPSNATHGDFNILTAGIDLKIRQRPPRRSFLYLLIGGGYGRATEAAYTVTVFDENIPTTVDHPKRTEGKYYLNAAIGIEYAVLGSSRLFFEARVTDLSGDIIRDYVFVNATVGIGF